MQLLRICQEEDTSRLQSENAITYLNIVADHEHLFMATMYPSSNGYFQHDNAPCHKEK